MQPFGGADDRGVLGQPALLLGERMPDVAPVQFSKVATRHGSEDPRHRRARANVRSEAGGVFSESIGRGNRQRRDVDAQQRARAFRGLKGSIADGCSGQPEITTAATVMPSVRRRSTVSRVSLIVPRPGWVATTTGSAPAFAKSSTLSGGSARAEPSGRRHLRRRSTSPRPAALRRRGRAARERDHTPAVLAARCGETGGPNVNGETCSGVCQPVAPRSSSWSVGQPG